MNGRRVIEVRGLTRRFGDFVAVNQVSFDVAEGEAVGIIGHNGSGKSTMLKCMAGILRPNDGTIVARKLAPDRRLLVASPEYLERHGSPANPEDLASHRCVVLADWSRWRFQNEQVVSVPRSFVANDGEATRAIMEHGLGVGISSLWNAGPSLRSGRLVEVLPDFPLVTESAIWALYSGSRLVPPKVRAMIDFLIEAYQPVPPWER